MVAYRGRIHHYPFALRRISMRRFALLLLAGAPSLVAAQGFGVYEQNTCTMARAGVAAAHPCADGSAIFFNPAGLGGLSGNRFSIGTTLIGAQGNFTDDILGRRTDLDNPIIPVPNVYLTHALSPDLTAGIGLFVPYGLQTNWPTEGFEGRFVGYHTDVRSIYIQPTLGYQVTPKLKLGAGVAYITSRLELRQRADFSQQFVPAGVPPGTTFGALGFPTGSDFADAKLRATGSGFAVNFGGIIKVSDRLSIGGHWLTRRQIDYDGTVDFTQIPTGLTLPTGNPLGLPAGTPVDALVLSEFSPGGPLSHGKVKVSIARERSAGPSATSTPDITAGAGSRTEAGVVAVFASSRPICAGWGRRSPSEGLDLRILPSLSKRFVSATVFGLILAASACQN